MKCIRIKSIIVLLFITVLSCKTENNPYFKTIQKAQEGHLRGAQIGDNIDQIKQLENEKFLKDAMDDYLHYDYKLDMGNSYTVTYDFSAENELYEIELAVFFDAIEDAGTLFIDFNEHFNRKFGLGELADDGFTIWTVKNGDTNIEVAMINDSEAYGYLSVVVRDLDY